MNNIESLLDTVIVGEALEKLRSFPDDFVDVTVTSPPYNKENNIYGWLVGNVEYTHSSDHMPEREYQAWQIEVLNELVRVTKPGGSVFYNHKIRWIRGKLLHPYDWVSKSRWTIRQEIVWDRTIAANVRGWRFWQVDERIYWLYKPIDDHFVGQELESRHAKATSIWRMKPVPRTDSHPAPFPLELPLRAIYSMPGEQKKVVLDPFCGIGTTLVAAKILGHHYIGIDISPVYAEYTERRLANWDSEKPEAQEELDKHVVNDPFIERKKRGTVNWPYGPKDERDSETGT